MLASTVKIAPTKFELTILIEDPSVTGVENSDTRTLTLRDLRLNPSGGALFAGRGGVESAVVYEAEPEYLRPYLSAARRHGEGFKTLLWESPRTQGVRFHAMTRVCTFHGKSVLDVGCGRGDLLDWLRERGIEPEHYTGLEAIEPLARAAMRKRRAACLIVQGDFVQEPKRLFAGADVIAFSGSL